MKNSAWYNKLWQTKMQELPIEEDENAMWQKMQGLLDQNMPVSSPVIVPKTATRLWIRLMYVLAAILTIALLYYAGSHMLADHHEKTNKPAGKHARINTDSAANNGYSAAQGSPGDKPKASTSGEINTSAGTDKNSDRQSDANQSKITGKLSASSTGKLMAANANKDDLKHAGNDSSATNKTPVDNHSSAVDHSTSTHTHKASGHSSAGRGPGIFTNSRPGLYVSHSQKHELKDHKPHSPYSNKGGKYGASAKNNPQYLADQSASAQANLRPIGNGATTDGTATKDAARNTPETSGPGNKTDSITSAKNTTAKQATDTKAKDQPAKSAEKSKTTSAKKSGNSKFELDAKLGANTNTGSTINPFLGISANYNFHKKWGVSIGINAPYTRIISGSYSKSNLSYVTVGDSNKQITHNSGKLTISSSRKIKYVDIPMLATYKVSDKLTITAGPVISIPIKANASKNTLGALSSSADTTTLKEVTPYVTSTTINSKVNFNISAGAHYTVKRFYFDAGYLQGVSPYTVSSSLGSGKIYYHTIQIGIGYQLFKSKSK